ncbi:hypothetical protein [Mesobacillus foraminis]|nr:hypothetical protein [Mesobacillus foraminis]
MSINRAYNKKTLVAIYSIDHQSQFYKNGCWRMDRINILIYEPYHKAAKL